MVELLRVGEFLGWVERVGGRVKEEHDKRDCQTHHDEQQRDEDFHEDPCAVAEVAGDALAELSSQLLEHDIAGAFLLLLRDRVVVFLGHFL